MDPISHALLGGLAAKSFKTSQKRFWVMVILGMIPDLDVVLTFFGPWAFAFQHRGLSHSLVGIILQSLFFSAVLVRFDPGPFLQRTIHYSFPIVLHVLCDYLTNYGVPFFSPFSFREFSLDLVGSLSLVPIFVFGGLTYLHTQQKQGFRAARPVWAILMLYLILVFSGKSYAQKYLAQNGERVSLIPDFAQPWEWRSLQAFPQSGRYETFELNLFSKQKRYKHQIAMPAKEFPVEASLKSPLVQKFLRENRWPVSRYSKLGSGWTVEWGTLIYSTRGLVRGKVEVLLDEEGAILDERRAFKFWNPAT